MLHKFSSVIFITFYFLNELRTAQAVAPLQGRSTSLKVQDADAAQKAQLANAVSGLSIPGTMAGQMQQNACSGQSVEANLAQVNQSLANKCIAEKKEKRLQLAEAAKTLLNEKDVCVQKVSPQAMNCHVKAEVRKIIAEPFYTLKKYGNVAEVFEQGQPIMLTITENFGYIAEAKDQKKTSPFNKSDQVSFKYNRLGGLLSQSGELPQPKKDNPCSACLEAMTKKAESVDGQTENCGGCDSSYSPASVQVGQFKMQSSDKKGSDDSNKKKDNSSE
ncbi:polar tube protein 2 (PTP2) [Pseudoloma neurophilia]|uniref:Polar tube protein 2 (PTP2) n=1 Tax=Pseudoloma neurophilia TaxID=146866 RepID=A0A0R0M995_9MICR|nr:polar tube protein 2 (PTP2) [Pseudoloma neurophilia]